MGNANWQRNHRMMCMRNGTIFKLKRSELKIKSYYKINYKSNMQIAFKIILKNPTKLTSQIIFIHILQSSQINAFI